MKREIKEMVNYDKSTIYKLCCKDPKITDIYVGSTTNFSRRKWGHKSRCNNENDVKYHLKVYQNIRDFGGWDNWDMVEVERYSATDKKDLHSRERFWLEQLGATLNKIIPTQSMSEYYAKNSEKYAEKSKEYYQKNKDKILEQVSEYRTNNKEHIAKIRAKYYDKNKDKILEQVSEYRTNNKEHIAKIRAKYYDKNKEKFSVQKKEKVHCDCGSEVTKSVLARHRKSKKHQKWLEQNTE